MEEWVGDAVRVERGSADEAELAVLAVVLMSALAGRRARESQESEAAAPRPAAAQWRRWDRVATYQPPHSWQ